jgi:hypothetical protein
VTGIVRAETASTMDLIDATGLAILCAWLGPEGWHWWLVHQCSPEHPCKLKPNGGSPLRILAMNISINYFIVGFKSMVEHPF